MLLVAVVAALVLILGAILPHVVLPETRGDWDGAEGAAARYALQRMQGVGGPLQRLPRTKMTVVDVEPDPSGCDWGYATPATGIVTVQTYTLFGLPFEKWIVDCDSESLLV